MPQLTALAGLGLLTVMVLAAGFHVMRGEFINVTVVGVLGLLLAFVAWGRFPKIPLEPRLKRRIRPASSDML